MLPLWHRGCFKRTPTSGQASLRITKEPTLLGSKGLSHATLSDESCDRGTWTGRQCIGQRLWRRKLQLPAALFRQLLLATPGVLPSPGTDSGATGGLRQAAL